MSEKTTQQSTNPVIKVGVTAVILSDSGVLLGTKSRPAKYVGKLVTPGGKLNFGEGSEFGLHREVLEETGLEIRIIRKLPTLELLDTEEHIIFLCFEAFVISTLGPVAGDDLSNVDWYPFSRLWKYRQHMTPITKQLLTGYL